MKKTLLYSVIALALVLGLILPMTVMASEITGSKVRDPDLPPYEVGQTVHFVMSVTNPGNNTNTNTLTRIWDTLPNGTVIEFLVGNATLVQTPGNTTTFSADYVVRAQDIIWIPTLNDYGVQNKFEAEGTDSPAGDDVYVLVRSNTRVNQQPPVGGEVFSISKLSVLVPWIALGAAIIAGAAMFVRRRKARS